MFKGGLPASFVNFHALLQHARALGAAHFENFQIISAHQGDWEAEEAQKIYRQLDIPVQEHRIEPEEFKAFWPSPYETIVFSAVPFSRDSK